MTTLADRYCLSAQVRIMSCKCDKECFICACIHLQISPSNDNGHTPAYVHTYFTFVS